MVVLVKDLGGCSVMDTLSKEMSKSVALLSTMVASGEWYIFSARLSTSLATGGGFGGGLVRCNGLASVLVVCCFYNNFSQAILTSLTVGI